MRTAAPLLIVVASLLLAAAVASHVQGTALAQSAGPYDLTWSTIDAGGDTLSTGGDYTLGGTIGQPDASVLRGGRYTLAGGFWGGGEVVAGDHRIYLPLVLRQ
ncbi:MAG: hypothetical protein PVG25_04585 [Anaerolineae bacterium]|jgi:hypothetical protein